MLEVGRPYATAGGATATATTSSSSSGGVIHRVRLRRQLTEEDKDELLHDPVHCYPAPFPRDSLKMVGSGGVLVALANLLACKLARIT